MLWLNPKNPFIILLDTGIIKHLSIESAMLPIKNSPNTADKTIAVILAHLNLLTQ